MVTENSSSLSSKIILKFQRVCVNGKSSAYILQFFFFFVENKLMVVDTEKGFLLLEFEP